MPLIKFIKDEGNKEKIEAFSIGIYVFVNKYDHDINNNVIKEADLIPSKGKESCSFTLSDLGKAFKRQFDTHAAMADDDKQLKVAEFLYDQWKGKNDLCKKPDHKDIYTCMACQTRIKDLKDAIPWDNINPSLYMDKLFVWILLNKKEWKLPKTYLVSWIRFLIVNACLSIERLLANKIMDYNEFSGIETNLMSTVERYASPICAILIGGLSTVLEPSYDRLGITPDKQNKLRINQSLKVWFDAVSKETLEDFLQKTILGAKTFRPQLNGLVYSLLLDLWRGEEGGSDKGRCGNWQAWVDDIEFWKAGLSTISKPLEPNVKPVYKGNVLCCSTPVSYNLLQAGNKANSKNKSLSFYPPLLWPTQHCPNCNKLMPGGVLKPSIWLQGERIQTITKTCQKSRIKLDSWKCSICNIVECRCGDCVTQNGKECIKCSVCKACACASDNCYCDVKAKCACNKCEMSFFSSKKKADSHIYILTKGKQNISCPLGEVHTTDGLGGGKGKGKTSKVFIDVNNFSDCMDVILATTNTYKDLCKLLVKCGFDQFEPLLQIKVIAYSQILIDNKDRILKSDPSLNILFENLEKTIGGPLINSTKGLFYHYKALSKVISTFEWDLEDIEI